MSEKKDNAPKKALPRRRRSVSKAGKAAAAAVGGGETAADPAALERAAGAAPAPLAADSPAARPEGAITEVMVLPLGGNLRRAVFWLILMLLFGLFLFIFSDVLLPFVAGFVLAYFLNPVVELCEKIGISRLWATVMIVVVAVILLVASLILLVPVLSQQLVGMVKNMPDYFRSLQNVFAKIDTEWLRRNTGINIANLQDNLNGLLSQAGNLLKTILPSLWSSGKAVMNMATLIVVTPVVAFYLLLDWDRMVHKLDTWIPRNRLKTVRSIVKDMDRAVAGFIRGQGTVCLVLGCYYAVMLTLCGINFGLLIGLLIGLIAFIPYIGSTLGLILSVGMACVQYWPDNWPWIVAVICVFLVGQFVEGYVLQPKLVGSSVGLHPVWLMFALFAFGSLFGFTGMLIAVPAAAAIGVLVRFALRSYLQSTFYDGSEKAAAGKKG